MSVGCSTCFGQFIYIPYYHFVDFEGQSWFWVSSSDRPQFQTMRIKFFIILCTCGDLTPKLIKVGCVIFILFSGVKLGRKLSQICSQFPLSSLVKMMLIYQKDIYEIWVINAYLIHCNKLVICSFFSFSAFIHRRCLLPTPHLIFRLLLYMGHAFKNF